MISGKSIILVYLNKWGYLRLPRGVTRLYDLLWFCHSRSRQLIETLKFSMLGILMLSDMNTYNVGFYHLYATLRLFENKFFSFKVNPK